MSETPLLETRNLTKHFKNKDGEDVVACDCVNITVRPGEALGIVGESGCGKSTLIKMLSGVLRPTSGEAEFEGKSILNLSRKEQKAMRRNIQMVFQDPGTAFNPRMKIRDIITEPLMNFKLIKKADRDRVAKEYLRMVELSEDMADRYPHELSGGQRQRVGLARALTLEPKLILCDEITSALDVSVQKSIIELLKKLQREKGIAFIYICHDLALVEQISDEIAVMYNGEIVEKIHNGYLKKTARHPYTRALLDAVFEPGMDASSAPKVLEGEVPTFHPAMEGCVFAPRCSEAAENCRVCSPKLQTIGEEHEVACFLHEQPETEAEHEASFPGSR